MHHLFTKENHDFLMADQIDVRRAIFFRNVLLPNPDHP